MIVKPLIVNIKMVSKYYFGLLFVITLIVQTLSAELGKEELECIEELKLNVADVNKYSDFDAVPEDNQNAVNFFECVMTKLDLYDENSKIKFDEFKKQTVEYFEKAYESTDTRVPLYLAGIDSCAGKTYEGTKGEIGIKFNNCIVEFMNTT